MSVPDPHLRISDADRERAMADLALHYADGRLDHEEYDERLDAIWTARTRADLAVLFGDLPRPQASRSVQASRAAPPGPARSGFRVPFLPVLALLVALSLLVEAPLWLLVFPLMFFMGRRRGWACPPGHARADYRRPRGRHGW